MKLLETSFRDILLLKQHVSRTTGEGPATLENYPFFACTGMLDETEDLRVAAVDQPLFQQLQVSGNPPPPPPPPSAPAMADTIFNTPGSDSDGSSEDEFPILMVHIQMKYMVVLLEVILIS